MKLRRSSWFILLFLMCVLPAHAQTSKKTDSTHHSLWKIQGKENTVYLLGSVHVLKEDDYPLAPAIESAFTNSGVVAFETDVGALEDPSLAMKLMAKAMLPEGQTLQTQVSPEIYKLFTNHLADAGLPDVMFAKFTPGLAAMTIEVLELQKLGLNPEFGIDKHFFPVAKKEGKQIVPLETVEFQMSLITDFSKEEGQALLKTTLTEMDAMKKDLGEMISAWRNGDADKLQKLLNAATEESPSLYKRLLTDRNRTWIPKIEEMTQSKTNAIVIVGAGHLVGKEGVVELLRKKGLKITQL